MRCQGCSLESDRADLFRIVNRFLRPDANLCPTCFQKAEHKTNTILLWGFFIIGIASIPLILWRPTHAIGFILLCISAIQLSFLISTILHELGHVVAGRLAGIRVFGIEIGRGQIVYEFFVGKFRCCFRTLPFGGCAHGVPRSAEFYRARQCVFVIGGPLVNFILLLVAIILLPLDKRLDSTLFDGVAPFLFLLLSNAALLFYSLWPRAVNNDVRLLWRILRTKKTEANENISWRYLYEADECRRKKDLEGAQAWVHEGLQKFPKSAALKMTAGSILYLQKKYREAARSYALLVGRNNGLKINILNNVAYCYLLTGDPSLLIKADTCSRLAMQQTPKTPAYKGTRGGVLVELGKYDEGLKLLHESMKGHSEKSQQALSACYIGIAEARQENYTESRNYFAVARRLDLECILLNREQV